MDIIKAMRYEDNRAKTYFYWDLKLNILIVVIALLSTIFNKMNVVQITLGSIAFIIPLIKFFFINEKQKMHTKLAVKVRRIAMLKDGFGKEPDNSEMMQLKVEVGDYNRFKCEYTAPYYASPLATGEKRLVDVTRECAFFTSNIAHRTGSYTFTISIIGLIAICVFVILLLSTGTSQQIQSVCARWIIIIISFFTVGDLANVTRVYTNMVNSCKKVITKCDDLLKNNNPHAFEVASVFEKYICIVSNAIPLPTVVYNIMKNDLNSSWRKYSGYEGATEQPAGRFPL